MPAQITEEELRRLYADTFDELYRYVSRRCGGQRELTEDVTQEAWLRAVREWRRSGAPDKPLAWLTTTARNLIINHLRRRKGIPVDQLSRDAVLTAVDNNTVSDSAEIARLVNEALARLPDREAQLLEAFHYDRHKMAQLAQTYGTSERAIEGRLRRARERLRRELESTFKAIRGLA
jgi:RNA polymerase sigma factor (sigma-70 family)